MEGVTAPARQEGAQGVPRRRAAPLPPPPADAFRRDRQLRRSRRAGVFPGLPPRPRPLAGLRRGPTRRGIVRRQGLKPRQAAVRRSGSASAEAPRLGRKTTKVEPSPKRLDTPIQPPRSCAKRFEMLSPRPVPP